MHKFPNAGRVTALTAASPGRRQFNADAIGRLARLLRFAGVGASGLGVNLAALALLLAAHLDSPLIGGNAVSAVLATQIAVAWNFALTERWVFKGHPGHWRRRLLPFWVISCATLLAQLPLAAVLQPLLEGSYLLATAAAVCALVATRFAVCDLWLYRRRPAPGAHACSPDGLRGASK